MIMQWSNAQWILFLSFSTAGLAALGLAAITIRHIRRRRTEYEAAAALIADWRTAHVVVDPTTDLLDVTAHVAPGPGSLTSLREVGPGTLTAIEPLVDDEVAAWFAAAFDPLLNEFRIAIEPAMRKAHLWELRGYDAGRGAAPSARAVLDHWRMDTPTGEWPLVAATC
jgi:hypothetical protein